MATDDNEYTRILSGQLDDESLREYVVGIDWIDTRPATDAYWEPGMYANQNTVTKLRNQYTIEHLHQHFNISQ